MIHRITKLAAMTVAATGIATAIAASALSPAAAVAASAHAQAPAATPVSDYWEQTHHNIHFDTGGVEIRIMSRRLPAGSWVVHADQTVVSFGPSDYVGCTIADTADTNLNTHRAIVGNPNANGAKGAASLVTVLSETAAVSVSAPTTVSILCEHDSSNGATPYVDANADLWAHRSANLVIAQLP